MGKVFREIFSDETGTLSSKRIAGMICVIALVAALVGNTFYSKSIRPSRILVESVALFAFGALGLTSIDKFTKIKNKK